MHKYRCAYCGKEFESGASGRKYCSHDCYICARFNKTPEEVKKAAEVTYPKKAVDDEDRPGEFVLKPRTPEEEKAYVEKFKKNNPGVMRNLHFAVTMNMCRQMFAQDILTVEDYWKCHDLMVEKYHPDVRTAFLYEEPYDMSNPEQWEKYHCKVPIRPVKRKDDTDEAVSETSAPKTKTDKKVAVPEEKEKPQPVKSTASSAEREKLFVADEIRKLKELLDCGALTQEEFDLQKKRLLNI